MNETQFQMDTGAYVRRLWVWMIVSLFGWCLFGWIALWADDMRSWEALLVANVFWILTVVSFFGIIFFGALLYGFYKCRPIAQRDLQQAVKDPELFRAIHRKVFGPIPWR